MMVSWVLCVGLLLLHSSWSLNPNLHYAVIFPSELRSDHPETLCIQLEGAQGESRVEISLSLGNENTNLVERTFQNSTFTCIQVNAIKLQVPSLKHKEQDVVGTLVAAIHNDEHTMRMKAKVLLKKAKSGLIIQTDKAVYKPGQRVYFRILAINEDYLPEKRTFPVVQLQDPGKNRIGQWLNVSVNQGMAEFSFALSSEPPLGEYTIRVKDNVQTFTVEEYVLPKFEVNLVLPKFVSIDSETFDFQICGRYTYGKPVLGQYLANVCMPFTEWIEFSAVVRPMSCQNFTGELDKSGCHTIKVKLENHIVNKASLGRNLNVKAFITERATGIQLTATGKTTVSNVINKISYENIDYNYGTGIPKKVVVKVTDVNDNPKQHMKICLQNIREANKPIIDTLVTDENGKAVFILNTSNWKGTKHFVVKTLLKHPDYVRDFIRPDYGQLHLSFYPFYSKSKSFLKLHSVDKVLPCEGQEEVEVEYIIKHEELKEEYKHLHLHYLMLYMGSIQDSGSLEINVKNKNEDLHGKATFKIPISAGKSSTIRALAYILLPNGEILADSAKYKVQTCFKNRVSLEISPDEVLPGSDVSVRVQAAPGSLCGLRVVDQSVVLMKPDKELTAKKVYDLFPYWEFEDYDYRIEDYRYDLQIIEISIPLPRRRRSIGPCIYEREMDVKTIFKGLRLKILTNAWIQKPMNRKKDPTAEHEIVCQSRVQSLEDKTTSLTINEAGRTVKEEERVRIHFPETLLFELIALGNLHRLTGFVVKSYSKSLSYIFIDESHLNHSITWLKNNRNESGCFRSVGRLFHNALKGGLEDDTALSAYITVALLESGLTVEDPLVRDSMACLQKASANVTKVYTMALMAYAFTLAGENKLRNDLLEKLEEKAVKGDGQIHWKRDSIPPKQDSYWHRAPSAEVELAAYMLLALISGPKPDMDKAIKVVNWLSKQQNPYGGFSSTQDTVVALQALAKYAEITYSEKVDVTVTVTSKVFTSYRYTGPRQESNMAVLEVKMLSGFIPVKGTVRQLEKDKVIKRSDIRVDKVTLYFDQLDNQKKSLSFMVEREIEVKDLKPAAIELYDYYETDDRAAVEYNNPCITDENVGNTR
ncbi:alpha-2-macroglobulin-like [Pyxicephalus adspersus]|uniref:alpha-2-macroglobulin-like n=1 Tax=Pyxicephalus adspersus TaxID=30357 RepID=UPI003B5B3885